MDLPETLYNEVIKRGQILHSDNFVDIGHGKFFVIIGVTDDSIVGFFFINSNINRFLWDKPEQMAVQYPLLKNDYGFLHHDSFICATKIMKLVKAEIIAGLKEDSVTMIDVLKPEHLNDVLETVRQSDLFSESEKRLYFY
ncbi:MAG: hypothetical protein IKZ99_10915 [Salinivirgaceae bacterium]|nr:hypothetical protein [Salinivirgaceae bacterium]